MKPKFICIHKRTVLYVVAVAVFLIVTVSFLRPAAVTVFQTVAKTERKLPIYCVDTPEKKVSISFDAAWGDT